MVCMNFMVTKRRCTPKGIPEWIVFIQLEKDMSMTLNTSASFNGKLFVNLHEQSMKAYFTPVWMALLSSQLNTNWQETKGVNTQRHMVITISSHLRFLTILSKWWDILYPRNLTSCMWNLSIRVVLSGQWNEWVHSAKIIDLIYKWNFMLLVISNLCTNILDLDDILHLKNK